MNIVADESVDRQIVDALRQVGQQVWYVAEMTPGISDEAVLNLANQQNALLITADKDFGELVFRQGSSSAGVVLFRLAGLSPLHKAQIVTAAIEEHVAALPGAFCVIMPMAIRIRQRQR